MKKNTIISLLFFLLLFIGCGSSETKNSNTDTNVNAEVVKKAAIKINDLTVRVHQNTYTTTSKMYNDVNKSLQSLENMSQNMTSMLDENMKTLDAGMKLLNSLSKPFKIDAAYSNTFSLQNNYTAVTPAFSITKILSDKYFLMSSTSKFFLDGQTMKKYFFDPSSLSSGWVQIIQNADKTKDLYLSILKINNDGSTQRVTNSFIIKSASLQAL